MRAVTSDEIMKIAGGLQKKHSNAPHTMLTTLPPVNVSAPSSWIPPTSWWYFGGGGGGGGGDGGGGGVVVVGGGGGGDSPTAEQEWENAAKTAIELAEKGALDSDLTSTLFTSTAYAEMAAAIGSIQFQYGINSYNSFESYGNNSFEVPGYDEFIHWDRVNWHAYDEGGKASPQEAMNNMFNDIDLNHHVSLLPTAAWSS